MILQDNNLISKNQKIIDEISYDEFVKTIRRHTFFQMYPEILDSFLERGEIFQYGSGDIIISQGEMFDRLIIPLNNCLTIVMPSGRATEDLFISEVSIGEMLAPWEVLDGNISSFTVRVTSMTSVFSISKSNVIDIFSKFEGVETVLKKISSSIAINQFCRWLLSQSISASQVVSVLDHLPPRALFFKKGSEPKVKNPSLFLIQKGGVGVSKNDGTKDFKEFLHEGDFLGASFAESGQNLNIQCHFLTDSYVHIIDLKEIRKFLLDSVWLSLCREPCIQANLNEFLIDAQFYSQGLKLVSKKILKNLGLTKIPKLVLCKKHDQSMAISALRNMMTLLGYTVPTHLIDSFLRNSDCMILSDFARVFEEFGFLTKIVAVRSRDLPCVKFPLLCYYMGKPIILIEYMNKRILILDQVDGFCLIQKSIFENNWSGLLLEVSKSPAHDSTIDESADISMFRPDLVGRRIIQYFNNQVATDLRNIFGTTIFQSLIMASIPTFFVSILGNLLGEKSNHILTIYFIGLILVLIFQTVAQYIIRKVGFDIDGFYKTNVRSYFYKLFLAAPVNYAVPIKTGLIWTKLNTIDGLMGTSRRRIVDLPSAVITFLIYSALVSTYFWQAGATLIIMIGICLFVAKQLQIKFTEDESSTVRGRQEAMDRWTENLTGMDSIKSKGVESFFRQSVDKIAIELGRSGKSYQYSNTKVMTICNLLFAVAPILAIYQAVIYFFRKEIGYADVVGISTYASYCIAPANQMINILIGAPMSSQMQANAGNMARIESDRKISNLTSYTSLRLKGRVRFDKVSFRYSDRSIPSIQDVSFTIEPGQVVAIVGRSGSGKTTLARLIARYIRPQVGRIFYDEIDSREINQNLLVQQIGFVTQTPQLFAGTIAENIAIEDDHIDREKVQRASIASGAHNFISNTPSKYNYYLTEEGVGLSQGQKHQVALARALYKEPRILILDEATAHLDPTAEKMVSDKLLRFISYRTIVVVVQRISTSKKADLILVMKNGRLVESGTHNHLLQQQGEYAELYRSQIGAE